MSTFLEEGRCSWKVAEPKRALVAADKKKTYPVCVLPAGVGLCGYVCVNVNISVGVSLNRWALLHICVLVCE